MKEIESLKQLAKSLKRKEKMIVDYFASNAMATAIDHIDTAIKMLEELERGEY